MEKLEMAHLSPLPLLDDYYCGTSALLDLDENDTLDLDEVLRKEEEDLAFCDSLTFMCSTIENKEPKTDKSEQDSDVEPILPAIELRCGDVLHDLVVLSSEVYRTVHDTQESWIRGQDLFANELCLLERPLSDLFALVRQELRLASFDAEAKVYGLHMIFESIEGSLIFESDAITSMLTLMDVLKVHIEAADIQGRNIAVDPFRIELGVTEKHLDDASQGATDAEDTDELAETKDVLTDDSWKTAIVPEEPVSCMHSNADTVEQSPTLNCDDGTSASYSSSVSLNEGASVEQGDEIYNVDDISTDEHLEMVDVVLEDHAIPLYCGCEQRLPKRSANEFADPISGESVDSFTPSRQHKKSKTNSTS
ncbi:hypothetical protein BGZ68_010464 [Mortierella alpina]|nr:hypothetical protein BGZ68_010464 [Mortierella alpina]